MLPSGIILSIASFQATEEQAFDASVSDNYRLGLGSGD